MESIRAFLLTCVFLEWSSLNRYITQKIKKSVTNKINGYNGLDKYIFALSRVLFSYVDKNYNIFIIGQINSNYGLKNIKGHWFVMTASLMDPKLYFELYDTLGSLIDDLDINQELIIETRIQIRHESAIKIQKYFKGWKARMKYRYNPETKLCKWLLMKEFAKL